jgi:hypothetical protein
MFIRIVPSHFAELRVSIARERISKLRIEIPASAFRGAGSDRGAMSGGAIWIPRGSHTRHQGVLVFDMGVRGNLPLVGFLDGLGWLRGVHGGEERCV